MYVSYLARHQEVNTQPHNFFLLHHHFIIIYSSQQQQAIAIMIRIASITILLLGFCDAFALAQPLEQPPTNADEEALIMRELEWAENTMESYKRHKGHFPLRSSITAPHVHTEEWKTESIKIFPKAPKELSDNADVRFFLRRAESRPIDLN
jgi:hypothetical protein